jgi:DNA-binding transcriptional MerR regulator
MPTLGFSLDDIRESLDSPDYSLAPVLDLHLARLTEQIALQQRLHQRLSALRARLSDGEAIPVAQFLETMEAITRIDKYLTPKQIQALESRREQHRAAHGTDPMQEFKTFVDALKVHLKAGADPASAVVQALASERCERRELTVDDKALADALNKMLREQPELRKRYELDEEVLAYLEKVMTIAQGQQ